MKKYSLLMLLAFLFLACNPIDKQLNELEKACAAQDLEKAEQIYNSIDVEKLSLKQTARWTDLTIKFSALQTQKIMEESAKQTQQIMEQSAEMTQQIMEQSAQQMNSILGK